MGHKSMLHPHKGSGPKGHGPTCSEPEAPPRENLQQRYARCRDYLDKRDKIIQEIQLLNDGHARWQAIENKSEEFEFLQLCVLNTALPNDLRTDALRRKLVRQSDSFDVIFRNLRGKAGEKNTLT
jgi:hypothetical protein